MTPGTSQLREQRIEPQRFSRPRPSAVPVSAAPPINLKVVAPAVTPLVEERRAGKAAWLLAGLVALQLLLMLIAAKDMGEMLRVGELTPIQVLPSSLALAFLMAGALRLLASSRRATLHFGLAAAISILSLLTLPSIPSMTYSVLAIVACIFCLHHFRTRA